jgi:three-Cys-motif partner protein
MVPTDQFDTLVPVQVPSVICHGKVAKPLIAEAARCKILSELQEMPLASDRLPARSSGTWVLDKHTILEKYCGIFSKGVSGKWDGKLAYLDLFSGPGKNIVRTSGVETEGSPLIALKYEFACYVFVDSPEIISILKTRLAGHRKFRQIIFIEGNCNEVVNNVSKNLPKDHLALAFIDPTGLHIHFETIRQLVTGRRIDLLMTIQFGMGINMNLRQYIKTEGEALNLFMGNSDWRGDVDKTGTVAQLARRVLDRYMRQLEGMGFLDTKDKEIIRNDRNTPLYSILLATRSKLGEKFWREINKINPSGQRGFNFQE